MNLAPTDILGKIFYCKTPDEAFKEVARRRSASGAEGLVTRFEESPYGGYRVYSTDAEMFVESLIEAPALQGQNSRRIYR